MGAEAHADMHEEQERIKLDKSPYSLGVSKDALGRKSRAGKQLTRAGLASYMVEVGGKHSTHEKTCFDWVSDRSLRLLRPSTYFHHASWKC